MRFLLTLAIATTTAAFPASYTHPSYVGAMDQGGCSSCYAAVATQVFSDHYNKYTGKSTSFSTQSLLSCMPSYWESPAGTLTTGANGLPNGCQGGSPFQAGSFIVKYGLDTLADDKYQSGAAYSGGQCDAGVGVNNAGSNPNLSPCYLPTCPYAPNKGPSGWSNVVKTVLLDYPNAGLSSEQDIMAEIYNHGPVMVTSLTWAEDGCFQVFFKQGQINIYQPGVCENLYYDTPSGVGGNGHVVSMIGWGTDSGTDYWILRNQFGTSWGNGGLFYVKRGYNYLNVESRLGSFRFGCSALPCPSRRKLGNTTANATSVPPAIEAKLVGGWTEDDLNSTMAVRVASHLANKTSDTVTVLLDAKKQLVAGWNHHVVFEAVAPDGTTHTHTAAVWHKLDDSLVVHYHKREPKKTSEWSTPGAIAGFACAGVALVAAMAVVAKKKRAAAAGAAPAEDANEHVAIPADATNAL